MEGVIRLVVVDHTSSIERDRGSIRKAEEGADVNRVASAHSHAAAGTANRLITYFGGVQRYARYSPDGKYLASAGSDRMVMVWNPQTGDQVKVLSGHEQRINALAFSPKDSNLLVSASLDGSVRIWNVAEGKALNMLFGQQGPVYGMAVSPDGNLIASGGRDPKIIIWNFQTGEKIKELTGLGGQINVLNFSPGGKELVAGMDDGKIKIFGP